MAQAADTLQTKHAPPTSTVAAHVTMARTPNPRILRARARLRAIHRSRRFKESARNK